MKHFFRWACLFLEVLVTIMIGGMGVFTLVTGTPDGEMWLQLVPVLAHLFFNLLFTILILNYSRSTFGSDAQLTPALLLVLSLSDIRVYPYCALHSVFFAVNLAIIAHVFQVALIAGLLFSMECMVYMTEINSKRINNGMAAALAAALLVGVYSPASPNIAAFLNGAYVTALVLRTALVVLGVIGALVSLGTLVQENVSKETVVKCIAYTMDIVALVLLVFPYHFIRSISAILLMLASTIILMLVARSRRIFA